jgi:hypothetical protein
VGRDRGDRVTGRQPRRPHRPRCTATIRPIVAILGVGALWLATAAAALGASPTPAVGGDPRSSGQGPGLVGDPAFAVLAVLAIGIGTIAITLAYIRLTGGRRA